jgi:hypothetical protein
MLVVLSGMASAAQAEDADDCFDVAAPMAESTPCYVPHRHKAKHRDQQDARGHDVPRRENGQGRLSQETASTVRG